MIHSVPTTILHCYNLLAPARGGREDEEDNVPQMNPTSKIMTTRHHPLALA